MTRQAPPQAMSRKAKDALAFLRDHRRLVRQLMKGRPMIQQDAVDIPDAVEKLKREGKP